MLDSLLLGLILILLLGFIGGRLAQKVGAPPLLGMMLVGIILGSEVGNLLGDRVLDLADALRTWAVMVILMRAGLGLDRDKLAQQGSVALRLGFLPAVTEAITISLLAMVLFQFDWLTGLLLGCIIGAESPAVIVPGMLKLKNLGWGVGKGIADAILTGSALSDVLILLLFSLLLSFLTQGNVSQSQFLLLPLQVVAQIALGIIIGYLLAKLVVFCAVRQKWTQNSVQHTLVTACLALLAVVLAVPFPYFSGYLAVMAMGFFLIEFSPPLARQLRREFNHLWSVAEIFLFVLMGATIQLKILQDVFISGILLLALGLLLGRSIGWYLATWGSNWTWREKLFLLPGNSAKATVQAAIGAIPLSMGIPGGDIILAIAALSILITAPLGAWAIPTFAPKLLTQTKVDPSKKDLVTATVIMGIVDSKVNSRTDSEVDLENAIAVLETVADLARRTNGKAIIVDLLGEPQLETQAAEILPDLFYQTIVASASERELASLVAKHTPTTIVINKAESSANFQSLSQVLLANNFNVPITLAINNQQSTPTI